MTAKGQIRRNILTSVVQVVVTGASIFLLYRYVIDRIGIEQFGIWALVLAVTSTSSIANLGIAASSVKFVSQYLALEDRNRVEAIVQTSVIFVAGVLALAVFLLYPLFRLLLQVVVEPADLLPAALSVLPYTLASFWLSSTSGVLLSCIDGYHRVDKRNVLIMAGAVLYLVLAVAFVPAGGLIGLARAQVVQAAIILAASWVVLKRIDRGLPLLPRAWDSSVLKEIIGYSVQFQVISITRILVEPVTKGLISRMGSLSAVGLFEFAYRMVVQLRAVIVTAHAALVPTITRLHMRSPEQLRSVYRESFAIISFLVLGSLPLLIALTPVVSIVWIGRYEPLFVTFSILVFVAWFSNIFSSPAYYANLGTGELKWNIVSHVLTGVLNACAGFLLGYLLGSIGVVIGFVFAVLAGAVLLIVKYQRQHAISAASLVNWPTVRFAFAGMGGMALGLLLFRLAANDLNVFVTGSAVVCIYFAVIAFPAWRHPAWKLLSKWFRDDSVGEGKA